MRRNLMRNKDRIESSPTKKESDQSSLKNLRSEYRKINKFKGVDEISNNNIFKNDNNYTINNTMEFEEKTESNFRFFCYYHYHREGVKIMLSVLYMRLFSSRINNFKDLFKLSKIIHIENIFHIISFIASIYFTSENYLKNQLINIIIFITFTLNHCIYVLLVLYKINDNYCHFISVPSELIFDFSLAFFLDIPHKLVLFSFCLVSLVMIISEKDLIGFPLFYFIFGTIFSLSLYFLYNIIIREIWALFDSFKRSYYNIKQGIIEHDPNPNFIISLQKVTYERNQSAITFGNVILGKKNNRVELLDLIHPKLKELFKNLIDETSLVSNETLTFFFPFCKLTGKDNNDIDEPNINGMFSFDYLKFRWNIVLVCKTMWKFKPATYVCLYPFEDIIANEIFSQYSEKFNYLLEQVISNNDIICSEILKINNEKCNDSGPKTMRYRSKKKISSVNKKSLILSKLNKNSERSTKQNKELIDIKDRELLRTTLFFCKSQMVLLYDNTLTREYYFHKIDKDIFYHLQKKNEIETKLDKLDVELVINYYHDYFYEIFKSNKCSIEYIIKNKDSYDILIDSTHLRILLFNANSFMVKCLNKKSETKQALQVEIKVEEKNSEKSKHPSSQTLISSKIDDKKDGKIEFIFTLFSGDPNIDLGKISKLLSKKSGEIPSLKDELIKAKYLGIGLLTIYHLLNDCYKNELTLLTRKNEDGKVDHSLIIKLPCKLEEKEDKLNYPNFISFTPDVNTKVSNKNTNKNSSNKQLAVTRCGSLIKSKNFFNYNDHYTEKILNMYYGITKSPLFNGRKIPQTAVKNNNNKNDSNKKLRLEIPIKKNFINSKFSFKDVSECIINDSIPISKNSLKSDSDDSISDIKLKINIQIIRNQYTLEFINNLMEESNGRFSVEAYEDLDGFHLDDINIKSVVNSDCHNYSKLINIFFINMNLEKEIEFAEKINKNNNRILIYGYSFRTNFRNKFKSSVKYDQKFDLSFGFENVNIALNNLYVNEYINNQ